MQNFILCSELDDRNRSANTCGRHAHIHSLDSSLWRESKLWRAFVCSEFTETSLDFTLPCEEDQYTRVTLLEYLKQLHPIEWENFVKDMILAEESAMFISVNPFANDEKGGSKTYDLPFYFIAFKNAEPEFTRRTRIWASLRAQTLYRTVSGMMNYSKAIKPLPRRESRSRTAIWWQY